MKKLQKLVLREATPLSEMEMIQVKGGYTSYSGSSDCYCAFTLDNGQITNIEALVLDDASCQTACDRICRTITKPYAKANCTSATGTDA